MATKKPTVKSVTAAYMAFRVAAHSFINNLRHPAKRLLLSVDAADAQGKLNGMTIVELITVAQLSANTDERVYLSVYGKKLSLFAEKIAPAIPQELYS